MKGKGRSKRRSAWLCFFRPVGESQESDERWHAGSKGSNSKVGAKKGLFKGEQGPPNLSRDSQNRLEAYLGRGQPITLHGASDSVLTQAAHTAAMERRLKGLLEDQASCNSNAAPCATFQVDNSGSSSVPLESGAASSFEGGSSPINAARMDLNLPQTPPESDSTLLRKPSQGKTALFVPGVNSEPQLHAAPATPSKLLNRVSVATTPPETSEHSKTHLHDATPTTPNSDLSQDSSIIQLADRPLSAPTTSAAAAAPPSSSSSSTHQAITNPFDSVFPRHSLHPSRSSHSLASVADSLFTEGSVKLEVFAPAPSYHCTIRTIPITLSSSGDHHTDASTYSIDGDTASLASIVDTTAGAQPQEEQHHPLAKHQRAKTMPHLHSNSQGEFRGLHDDHLSVDGVSLKSNGVHARRHTAIVLLSHSEDEDEDNEDRAGENGAKANGAAEESATISTTTSITDLSVTSSSIRSGCRGNRVLRRRLSEVFEGHHIPLQKLRKQMGNPEDPPGDLLSLMARRVFSQQGIMSRVNSEGIISVLDAHSSFNTPSNQDRVDNSNSNSDWLETRISSLPRIRTQVVGGVSGSAHSSGLV